MPLSVRGNEALWVYGLGDLHPNFGSVFQFADIHNFGLMSFPAKHEADTLFHFKSAGVCKNEA